ncbi:MAG: transposase [Candidatus Paceibacterota bacterium]|jgi:putative transposase
MAMRKTEFAVGEWYHCYNRGVDKRITFEDKWDYLRFLEALYLANSEEPLRRDDFDARTFEKILRMPREKTLVTIGAFCLMPNHFHIVLKEIEEGGITKFMHKLGTAYTMYFNARYERTGNLFVKPFRSRHIDKDRYFQHLVNYLHCNPAELYEPDWKTGKVTNLKALIEEIIKYPYSSFCAYEDKRSLTRAILNDEVFNIVRKTPAKQMIGEARAYYLENPDLL